MRPRNQNPESPGPKPETQNLYGGGGAMGGGEGGNPLQGFLAHKKHPPPRTLQ